MSRKKSKIKESVLWADMSGMTNYYLFLNVKTGYYLLHSAQFKDLERGWTLETVRRKGLDGFVYSKIDWSKYEE